MKLEASLRSSGFKITNKKPRELPIKVLIAMFFFIWLFLHLGGEGGTRTHKPRWGQQFSRLSG